MAKIVRFYETGGPEVLRVEDGDPGEPGAGEVLLKIDGIGLNRSEAAFRGGHYLVKPSFPALIGGEATGSILKLGPGVEGWSQGEAVIALPTFMFGQYGFYATEAIAPVSCLVKLPDGIDPVQSSALWVAFLTAYGGLVETGKVAKGDFVVLTAASSSVGLAAIQVARDQGAIPIATTRRRDKFAPLLAVGAAHVIASEEQDVAQEVARITDGKGASLIFDSVAGPFAEQLFGCLSIDGTLMVYGGLSNQPATFPRHLAIGRNLTMRGYTVSYMNNDPVRRARALDYLVERVRDGRFKMPIAHKFPIAEAIEAHRRLEENRHVGKIVMTP
ncbi:MAG: zinc-dependent alcohol dehydrogenase family protein [Hyphomonadaceae bacterium]|nr:zinc-dependent alcohol dehydrogenase family protein [Hyphomonadaceae bacterium]